MEGDYAWARDFAIHLGGTADDVVHAEGYREMEMVSRVGNRRIFAVHVLPDQETVWILKTTLDRRVADREYCAGQALRRAGSPNIAASVFRWSSDVMDVRGGSRSVHCNAIPFAGGVPLAHAYASLSDRDLVRGMIEVLRVYAVADPREHVLSPSTADGFSHGDLHSHQVIVDLDSSPPRWTLIDFGLSSFEFARPHEEQSSTVAACLSSRSCASDSAAELSAFLLEDFVARMRGDDIRSRARTLVRRYMSAGIPLVRGLIAPLRALVR